MIMKTKPDSTPWLIYRTPPGAVFGFHFFTAKHINLALQMADTHLQKLRPNCLERERVMSYTGSGAR